MALGTRYQLQREVTVLTWALLLHNVNPKCSSSTPLPFLTVVRKVYWSTTRIMYDPTIVRSYWHTSIAVRGAKNAVRWRSCFRTLYCFHREPTWLTEQRLVCFAELAIEQSSWRIINLTWPWKKLRSSECGMELFQSSHSVPAFSPVPVNFPRVKQSVSQYLHTLEIVFILRR